MAETKVVGRIIRISKDGWGFIASRDIQFTRIFFHWTALVQNTLPFLELKVGMYVEFTPVQIPDKGWRAVHVRVVDKPKKIEPEPEIEDTDEPILPLLPE